MDSEHQRFEPMPRNDRAPKATTPRKKTFEPPLLQEWGSILDLTRGNRLGFEDLPEFSGGTRLA